MKKTLTALMLVLLIFSAAATCAEGEAQNGRISVSMLIDGLKYAIPTRKTGDTIEVTIRIENASGEDFASEMYLFDPEKQPVGDFPQRILKAGESVEWSGKWMLTEKQAESGKLTYRIQYLYTDENGETAKSIKNLTKKIAVKTAEATPEPDVTPEPTPIPEERPQVFLYSVRRPNPGNGSIGVICIDEAGDLWSVEKADVKYPFREEDILQLLRERRGMKLETNLIGSGTDAGTNREKIRSLADMAKVVPQADGSPAKTGVDIGEDAVYALRTDREDNQETVLLGMSGSWVFENRDPNAQALYLFMYRTKTFGMPIGFAAEGLAPHGFEMVSVRDFFGLQKADPETVTISAVMQDCEAGPIECEMTEQDRKEILALLERGVIIGKENDWMVTGGTTSYSFSDAEGNWLGSIELYQGLAVGRYGMYRISLLPRSTDRLPEEERKLLQLKIDGIGYELGKSTPRDLIRNGWPCGIEPDGAFSFTDPEMYSTIYVYTEHGGIDEPIRAISCQWAYTAAIEYCGFDGIVNPEDPEDMDTAWYIRSYKQYRAENPEEELPEVQYVLEHWHDEEDDDDGGYGKDWSNMQAWLETLGRVDEESDNGTDVEVTLSDGFRLSVFSANSPVCLTLGDEQYIRFGTD